MIPFVISKPETSKRIRSNQNFHIVCLVQCCFELDFF